MKTVVTVEKALEIAKWGKCTSIGSERCTDEGEDYGKHRGLICVGWDWVLFRSEPEFLCVTEAENAMLQIKKEAIAFHKLDPC